MGENCCLCFPLECGVKTIAILSILCNISVGIMSYYDAEYNSIFWPMTVAYTLMSLIWIYTLVSPSQGSRSVAFLGFIVLCLCFGTGYYAKKIMDGSAVDWLCDPKNIENLNDDLAHIEDGTGEDLGEPITEDQCKYGGKPTLIADCIIKLAIDAYFAYVIMRWSRNDEGYSRN